MYSLATQYDLKKKRIQQEIDELESQLKKTQAEGTVISNAIKTQPEKLPRDVSQDKLKTVKPKPPTVVPPAVSQQWKNCFDFKPSLMTVQIPTYYDKDDYAVEDKFEYDNRNGDAQFIELVMNL